MPLILPIRQLWDGRPATPAEAVLVRVDLDPDGLLVQVQAPWHGDPPPPGPPGPTWALWEHEVVELFLLGPEDRYLELELGPHGHHLLLQLHGRRHVVARALPVDWRVDRRPDPARPGDPGRWSGRARLDPALLPPGPLRANATAIHGLGADRRYLSHAPLPGPAPDFHRLEGFVPVPAGALSAG